MRYVKILIFVFAFSSNLYSLTYFPPKVSDKGVFNIGAGGSVITDGSFEVLMTSEYSFSQSLSTILKLGYRDIKDEEKGWYGNIEQKILIAERFGGTDYLSLTIGGHYCEIMGIDFSITLGNSFKNFDNYAGFDCEINFFDNNEIKYPAHFILGVKLKPFSSQQGLIIEAGLPVTSFTSYQFGILLQVNIFSL